MQQNFNIMSVFFWFFFFLIAINNLEESWAELCAFSCHANRYAQPSATHNAFTQQQNELNRSCKTKLTLNVTMEISSVNAVHKHTYTHIGLWMQICYLFNSIITPTNII